MKTFHLLLFPALLLLAACQQPSNADQTDDSTTDAAAASPYPAAFQRVLAAHGGLELWQRQQGLSYEIVKPDGNEKQVIDLKDRRERIDASNFTMGYDGSHFWLAADTSYHGDPIFYKNLMFYFYAMPFVLADAGIRYAEAEPLVFGDKTYPGLRISYEPGVGVSPEDEYFLHYDADTYQMAWLGYTVTYETKAKSSTIKWIRYDDWMDINGLKLPKSMNWHTTEDNKPVAARNRRAFEQVTLSLARPADSLFAIIPGAKLVVE